MVQSASEIASWLESACSDMAFGTDILDMDAKFKEEFHGDKNDKYLMQDCYADYLYNDVGTIRDLLGDRVYENGKNTEERIALCEELLTVRTFSAWQEAVNLIKDNLSTIRNFLGNRD